MTARCSARSSHSMGWRREIAGRAGYSARRLTRLQRERVLERAARRHRAPTRSATRRRTAGFAAAAGRLIAELERALVTPQRFAAALRRVGGPRPAPARRTRTTWPRSTTPTRPELDRLGRVDSELYAWRALDALRAAPGRWGPEPVFFYGFDDLHPLERDAIETLAARGRGRGHRVADLRAGPRGAPGARRGGRGAAPARPSACSSCRRSTSTTTPARARRSAPPRAPPVRARAAGRIDPGRAIALLEAGGERAEAELVGRRGARAAARRRARRARSSSSTARSARAAPLVEHVFGAATGSRSRPTGDVPLGAHGARARAAGAGPLRAARRRARRAPPTCSTYLRAPGLLEPPERSTALEAERPPRGRCGRAAAGAGASSASARPRSTRCAPREDPAAELCATRAAAARRAAPRARRRVLDRRRGARRPRRSAALAARARRSSSELGETRLPAAELIELLETLEVAAPARAPGAGAVLLADPLAIRARRFRAVFVCGLQEGEFPLPPAPEPFLSDELRRELALAAAACVLRPREDALGPRALPVLRVRLAGDRAGRPELPQLRRGGQPGAALAVHRRRRRAARRRTGRERRRRRLLADVVWPRGEAPTERELARAARPRRAPARRRACPSPIAVAVGAGAEPRPPPPDRLGRRARDATPTARSSGWSSASSTPSALEPDAEPLVRGALHPRACSSSVLRRLGGAGDAASRCRDALELLDEILPSCGRTRIAAGAGRRRSCGRRRCARSRRDLRRYLAHEARRRPRLAAAASSCGSGSTTSRSRCRRSRSARARRVRVRGIVDRVDADDRGRPAPRDRPRLQERRRAPRVPGRAVGARPPAPGRAVHARRARAARSSTPVAGFYQPLGGDDLRPRGAFLEGAGVGGSVVANDARDRGASSTSCSTDARRARSALAARLRDGRAEPCPPTCSRDGCRYPGICRA